MDATLANPTFDDWEQSFAGSVSPDILRLDSTAEPWDSMDFPINNSFFGNCIPFEFGCLELSIPNLKDALPELQLRSAVPSESSFDSSIFTPSSPLHPAATSPSVSVSTSASTPEIDLARDRTAEPESCGEKAISSNAGRARRQTRGRRSPADQRTAHCRVERRYRNSLNASLERLHKTLQISCGGDSLENKTSSPPRRISKSSIITSATEHIIMLRREQDHWVQQNVRLTAETLRLQRAFAGL